MTPTPPTDAGADGGTSGGGRAPSSPSEPGGRPTASVPVRADAATPDASLPGRADTGAPDPNHPGQADAYTPDHPGQPDTGAPDLVLAGRRIDLSRPLLMGIVNATPDSFSDGGEHDTAEARVRLALDQVAHGAHIVDVGGQSGITGVPEVPVAEEIARVVPVVAGLHEAAPDVVISVDTYRPAVVEAVLDAGAAIVNDVSGLLHPEVAALVAGAGPAS